ncbi:hypothetical protein DL98DRAFT_626723 [Cadophora sp. DSE1049]|nr:hypothetical protein DL98DRAFT_626723 [Cadophora sp. DSE1049]
MAYLRLDRNNKLESDRIKEMRLYLLDHGVKLNHHDEKNVLLKFKTHQHFVFPEGGGNAIIQNLLGHIAKFDNCDILCTVFRRFPTLPTREAPDYFTPKRETAGVKLLMSERGEVTGVKVRGKDGLLRDIHGKNVMLVCGGFEGNREMLAKYVGKNTHTLPLIAPGLKCNTSAGLTMALEVGAGPAGSFDGMHCELVDMSYPLPKTFQMWQLLTPRLHSDTRATKPDAVMWGHTMASWSIVTVRGFMMKANTIILFGGIESVHRTRQPHVWWSRLPLMETHNSGAAVATSIHGKSSLLKPQVAVLPLQRGCFPSEFGFHPLILNLSFISSLLDLCVTTPSPHCIPHCPRTSTGHYPLIYILYYNSYHRPSLNLARASMPPPRPKNDNNEYLCKHGCGHTSAKYQSIASHEWNCDSSPGNAHNPPTKTWTRRDYTEDGMVLCKYGCEHSAPLHTIHNHEIRCLQNPTNEVFDAEEADPKPPKQRRRPLPPPQPRRSAGEFQRDDNGKWLCAFNCDMPYPTMQLGIRHEKKCRVDPTSPTFPAFQQLLEQIGVPAGTVKIWLGEITNPVDSGLTYKEWLSVHVFGVIGVDSLDMIEEEESKALIELLEIDEEKSGVKTEEAIVKMEDIMFDDDSFDLKPESEFDMHTLIIKEEGENLLDLNNEFDWDINSNTIKEEYDDYDSGYRAWLEIEPHVEVNSYKDTSWSQEDFSEDQASSQGAED